MVLVSANWGNTHTSGNCLQCIFSRRKRVCLSTRAVWKLSVQSTNLKSIFLPGACSCTKSSQAHQLETAPYPCCGMATDKICPQLDKDTAVTRLLGTTRHFVLLRAFSDFLRQVILWWFSPEDTHPPRQQQEPSAPHVHPQPSPGPCQPWGLAARAAVPQDGTRPQGEGQQLSDLAAASGQSCLSHLMETCSLFPFFSLAEHFLAGEPKRYLPAFAKTSRESKAEK